MSAAVECIRAMLSDGVTVKDVRLEEPHLSAMVASGLLDAGRIHTLDVGDMPGRMVVITPDTVYLTVLPSL